MTRELYSSDGKRKYLTSAEQDQFLDAARSLDRAELRTFALTLAYTGCRISEALELTVDRVDMSDKSITFRTLKQGKDADGNLKIVYRSVPVPDELLDALELVHRVRKIQKSKGGGETTLLWKFKRAMASRHVLVVMVKANISGKHATAKGLRHGFGIRMIEKSRNPRLVQRLLGHKSLETTAIYMDLIGDEARAEVVGAW